jgi:hypothetical protein
MAFLSRHNLAMTLKLEWATVDAAIYVRLDVNNTTGILETSVDVDGKNPFGPVTGEKIAIKASVIRSLWQSDPGRASWSSGSRATIDYGSRHVPALIHQSRPEGIGS